MSTIVNETQITFKELKQKIYKFVCDLGCEMTRMFLEDYDDELAKERGTSTTGESISAMGAWNMIQKLGERISEEEDQLYERVEIRHNKHSGKERVSRIRHTIILQSESRCRTHTFPQAAVIL